MILRLLDHNEDEIQEDWATRFAATRYLRQYFYNYTDELEVVNGVRQIEDDKITDYIGEKYIPGGYARVDSGGGSFTWIPR